MKTLKENLEDGTFKWGEWLYDELVKYKSEKKKVKMWLRYCYHPYDGYFVNNKYFRNIEDARNGIKNGFITVIDKIPGTEIEVEE